MAFELYSNAHGAVTPLEYLPAEAGTYEPGQMLAFKAGKLSAIAEDEAGIPPYMSHAAKTIGKDGDNILPCEHVSHDAVYETTLDAAAAGLVPGNLMKVKAGGLAPTGTEGGSFVVVSVDGTAEGDKVRGRFEPQQAAASEAV